MSIAFHGNCDVKSRAERRGFHSLVAKMVTLLHKERLEGWRKILFKDVINQSGYFGVLETTTEIEQALAFPVV